MVKSTPKNGPKNKNIRILLFPSVTVLGQPQTYGENRGSSKLKSGILQEHVSCFTASYEDHGQIFLISWAAMSSKLKNCS